MHMLRSLVRLMIYILDYNLLIQVVFCRPNSGTLEPRVAYRHPVLDKKFHVDSDSYVLTDDENR